MKLNATTQTLPAIIGCRTCCQHVMRPGSAVGRESWWYVLRVTSMDVGRVPIEIHGSVCMKYMNGHSRRVSADPPPRNGEPISAVFLLIHIFSDLVEQVPEFPANRSNEAVRSREHPERHLEKLFREFFREEVCGDAVRLFSSGFHRSGPDRE